MKPNFQSPSSQILAERENEKISVRLLFQYTQIHTLQKYQRIEVNIWTYSKQSV